MVWALKASVNFPPSRRMGSPCGAGNIKDHDETIVQIHIPFHNTISCMDKFEKLTTHHVDCILVVVEHVGRVFDALAIFNFNSSLKLDIRPHIGRTC